MVDFRRNTGGRRADFRLLPIAFSTPSTELVGEISFLLTLSSSCSMGARVGGVPAPEIFQELEPVAFGVDFPLAASSIALTYDGMGTN